MLTVTEPSSKDAVSERELAKYAARSPRTQEVRRSNQRKLMTRDAYDDLMRLADDGCALVMDLEEFQVIDTEIQTGG